MMKRKTNLPKRVLALALTCAMLLACAPQASAVTDLSSEDYEKIINEYGLSNDGIGFEQYRKRYEAVYPDATIEVDAADYVRYEAENASAVPEIRSDYEGMSGESIVTSEDSLVEYEVTVQQSGYYDLSFLYYPIEGKNSAIQRSIFLDGELPYEELSLVEFYRVWTMNVDTATDEQSGQQYRVWSSDNQGNDLKPGMIEKPEWIESYVYDSEGYITDRLSLYLSAGTHTITITALREPMLLRKLILSNSTQVADYDTVKRQWDAAGATETSGQVIRIEAENATKSSSQMLYAQQDQSSPSVYPSSAKELLNNTIGGYSWRSSGQWIEWEFQVEQSGYYNIGMYVRQNFMKGIYVSRKISIDDEVLFEELNDYGFRYRSSWDFVELSDEDGEAYYFYLEAGKHTLRMEVVLGEFADIISRVQDCVTQLNSIYRSVIRITGVSPDVYRDYQIEDSLPGLEDRLVAVKQELDTAIADLRALIGKGSDKESVLVTMSDQLEELIYDQERFTEVLSSYKINVRATANWITQVVEQPLQLDRIYIYSPDETVKIEKRGFFSGLWYEICRLFYSFVIDYNQIGNVSDDSDATTITLWVGTGRDQANIIKSLIDSDFTPDTGINVNVQLVDMGTLLKATLAGEGPDVAIQVANTTGAAGSVLGTGNDTPVNYGIRNAVLDLTQFDDYAQVASRFSESSMTQLQFNGATYALPETETFMMMFYRKDILSELGMSIPQTWDDVKVAMTVLSQNQMEFGMLPSEQLFLTLLYQNGGTYYSEDGSVSVLDSDVAISTFRQYCAYYTDYKLDKETSVAERFRTGECPIILSDYTFYNTLKVSAPDIDGLWGIAMVPGTKKSDGSIDHTTASTGLCSLIMSATEEPDASWEFLKWWSSAQTQTRYAYEMESLQGEAGRVPTANIEAFQNLAWSADDMDALLQQHQWVRGIVQVPGGYYTWRNISNAFYTVTTDTDTASPRELLMDKVVLINAELQYKWEELGLDKQTGGD